MKQYDIQAIDAVVNLWTPEMLAIRPNRDAFYGGKMKVTQRSPSVTPEKTVKGTGPVSGSVSASKLDDLRNSAQKSGNWDAYFTHKRAITKK